MKTDQKKPSTAEWENLKLAISGVIGWAYLECDGFLVRATVQKCKRRLVISIYVDGRQNWNYARIVTEDEIEGLDDIPKKFYCFQAFNHDAKTLKIEEIIYGKKKCKEMGRYKKCFIPMPFFNTPGALVAKLKKSCEAIAIIDNDSYEQKLAEKTANRELLP